MLKTNLKSARKRAGMTQKEVASRLGGCGTLYNLAGLGAGVFLLRVRRA